MSWKPTKAGYYKRDHDVFLWDFSGIQQLTWIRRAISSGPWSLLSPDWQDGAPSDAQLDKWRWWTILVMGSGLHSAEFSHIDDGGLFQPDESYTPIVDVIKSAPIQPDIENGPLWVPLEVAVEKT